MKKLHYSFIFFGVIIIVNNCFARFIKYGRYGKYGKTLFQKQKKNGAVVEKIRLFSRENDQSFKKIVRKGYFVWYKNARATIVISHGFMCDKYDIGFLRWLFPSGEYNVIYFDYRAHGELTQDQDCTFGKDEAYDLIAAAKFVRHHPYIKKKPVFVYGFSMGAVSAIEAQAKKPSLFDGMILDCPFDSSETIIKRGLANLKFSLFGYEFDVPGKRFLEKYAFHPYVQSLVKMALKAVARMDTKYIRTKLQPLYPVESIKKVDVPCFFIHCRNDDRITYESVKSVYKGALGYKRLWLTNGRRHYDSFFYHPDRYSDMVCDFLNCVLTKKFEKEDQEGIIEDAIEDAEYFV